MPDAAARVVVCSAFPRCGGCQTLHQPYDLQLRAKTELARARLSPWLGSSGVIRPILGCPSPSGMRAKAIYPLARQGGRLLMGFFEQGSHRIVESPVCPAQAKHLTEAARRVRVVLSELRPSIHDARRNDGYLRHILLRLSPSCHELLLVLVTRSEREPLEAALVSAFREALGSIRPRGERAVRLVGIVRNVNDARGTTVLGPRESLLWGRPYLEETVGRLTLRVSASSFYQVNPVMAARLYQLVVRRARLTGRERVVDAYCGVGAIALHLSDRAAQVTGIESSPRAVRDAMANAERNHCSARFEEARVETALGPQLASGVDLLVVDPPRAGLSKEVTAIIGRAPPPRLIYVSCSLASLARDAERLRAAGLELDSAEPLDLFPHTEHIEVLAVFSSPRAGRGRSTPR
ncbi:MAG: 23S rRNA (uracil(1939)-C(5))-methyltransferase RlmD [Planctomycetota bacterium]